MRVRVPYVCHFLGAEPRPAIQNALEAGETVGGKRGDPQSRDGSVAVANICPAMAAGLHYKWQQNSYAGCLVELSD